MDVYIYKSVFMTTQPVKVFDQQILLDAVKKWKRVAHMLENVMKPLSIKNAKKKRVVFPTKKKSCNRVPKRSVSRWNYRGRLTFAAMKFCI